jgi:hypothetical protein
MKAGRQAECISDWLDLLPPLQVELLLRAIVTPERAASFYQEAMNPLGIRHILPPAYGLDRVPRHAVARTALPAARLPFGAAPWPPAASHLATDSGQTRANGLVLACTSAATASFMYV